MHTIYLFIYYIAILTTLNFQRDLRTDEHQKGRRHINAHHTRTHQLLPGAVHPHSEQGTGRLAQADDGETESAHRLEKSPLDAKGLG